MELPLPVKVMPWWMDVMLPEMFVAAVGSLHALEDKIALLEFVVILVFVLLP